MRQYAGYATAAESNNRYRTMLEQGQTGLSVAFDLPTQIGYDSDHPLAQGEVGKVALGIARMGSKDMGCKFQNSADNDKLFDFEDNKDATLVCRALIDSRSPYVTTVALDFSYDYVFTKKKSITLTK